MSSFNEFLKSGLPEMIIGAMAEAAQEIAQEEQEAKNTKQMQEKNTKIDNSKVLALTPVKSAAETIGKEDCESCEKMAASVFYTYASFIAAGFSSKEAFELVKATLM